MKRYLLPILTVFALTISLIGCSLEESASEFDEQAVFQKVDNLQVENLLRQQELEDKISSEMSIMYHSLVAVSEWREQLEFLRQQYRQLQGIKYELEPEALDNLLADSLLEQQRLKVKIESNKVSLSDMEREEELNPGTFFARKVKIEQTKRIIRGMSEQLEFLMKQYEALEELRDFILLSD